MWKTLHPNIRTRIEIQFLSRFGSSLIFPFMAIYFTKAYSVKVAGTLVMFNVVASFLAGVYGGHLTDVIGRRKILFGGELVKCFTTVGIIVVNSPWFYNPALTFVMMLGQNLASGLINPASEAMLVDVSTEENRSFMYAISYWASNLSLMLGIMIGGWFFEDYFFVLLLFLLVINLLTTYLTYHFINETHAVSKKSHMLGLGAVLRSYREVARDHRFLIFTLGGIAILGIENQRNNYISVHLAGNFQPMDFAGIVLNGVKMLGLSTTINTFLIVILTAPVARLISKQNPTKIFKMGVSLFALGFGLLAFTTNFWIVVLSSVVLSIGELLYVPTRQAKLAELVDMNNRGAYLALNGTIFQLGKLVGAAMLIISPYLSSTGMMLTIFLLGIIAITLTTISLKKKKE